MEKSYKAGNFCELLPFHYTMIPAIGKLLLSFLLRAHELKPSISNVTSIFEAKQENSLASLQISLIQQLYSTESRKERKLGLCLRHSEHAVYDGG